MQKIESCKNILDFTLSSLLRRKGKNTALLCVYTLVIFLLASVMFFSHAIRKEASLLLQQAPEMVVQKMMAGRQDLVPLSYIDRIRDIRGVSAVRGRLWGYYYDAYFGANYTVMAPSDNQPASGNVVIGDEIARSRKLVVGDVITLNAYTGEPVILEISGILPAQTSLVSADLIIVSPDDFRTFFGMPKGYATDLVLEVRNPRELGTIAQKIVKILPDTRPIMRDEILRTYDSVFSWRSGLLMVILFVSVIAFVIFAWDKASGLAAEEKREIGILKAIGWETADVLQMKFWEGLVISLTAFFFGILLAYGHVFFFSSLLFEPVLKGWSVLYPEFRLIPFLDPFQIATLFFLTVLPYTVATIIPSWRAATIDPDMVMRT